MEINISENPQREVTQKLAEAAREFRWKDVLDLYRTHGEVAHKAVLNTTKDTALRMAISAGQREIAKELVDEAAKTEGALEQGDWRGDTVLHIAAYLGQEDVCSHIAEKNALLIGMRNDHEKETPLFYTAHFGRIEAFLSLYKKLGDDKALGYVYGRRGDGETILHTSISRNYYEIAYHIIKLYPKFVYAVNANGFSPLYLMASTPSAFRSGCPQIRGIHQLAYYFIHVSKLKMRPGVVEDKREHPEKQQTCIMACISSPWHRIMALMGYSKNLHDQSKDEEGQHRHPTPSEDEQGKSKNGSHGPKRLVIITSIISSCLQCLIGGMSAIFGLGKYSPTKVKDTKQKNVWSEQIMKELVEEIADFAYEHNGMHPGWDDAWEKWLVDNKPRDEEERSTLPDTNITAPRVGNSEDTNGNKEEITKNDEAKREVDITSSDQNQKEIKEIATDDSETEAERREREALESIKKKETPLLLAARNGVIEIVREVLESLKIAIHDSNIENKNVALLAAENRRANVYDYLLKTGKMRERIFGQTDNDGNSVLHLAAKLISANAEPWHVPGPALQMQCEVKWYEFVKGSMSTGPHFFRWFNNKNESPENLFKKSHKQLVKDGGDWLNKTSDSISLVATLIATVAFATSAIVPGGVDDFGKPHLEEKPAFSIFAVSSLVALCGSIICVMMFLAILTSRYQDEDFGKDLPRKFLIGLTSLFASITAMLISFCAGHSFVLKEELKYAALPVYAVTCLAVTVVTVAQFPFYFDLVMITFSKKSWSHKNI